MYDYWSLSLPTDIENWPPGLLERSIDTVFVRLTQEQATALIATNSYGLEMRGEKEPEAAAEVLDELRLILSNVISDRFPDGAFVRLGSRSPKDSFDGIIHGFKCHNGQRVLELLNDSERVYDDLALAKHHSYLPVLALRKWIDIADWQEFRSFVKNRKLAGISQYYYYDFYPRILPRIPEIEAAIREECGAVIPLLPADDMVVDFFVSEENGRLKAKMVEINPFFRDTDPCLFDWDEDDFGAFEFRYVTEPPEKPDLTTLLCEKEDKPD